MLARPYISRRRLVTGAAALAAFSTLPRQARAATVTLNGADKGADITLSQGDLFASCGASSAQQVRANYSASTGNLYIEGKGRCIGLVRAGASLSAMPGVEAGSTLGIGFFWNGQVYRDNSVAITVDGGSAVIDDNWRCIAAKLASGLCWFRLNDGTWKGAGGTAGDPVAGTNGYDISSIVGAGAVFPSLGFSTNGDYGYVNLGARPMWSQAVPSGFSAPDSAFPVTLAAATYPWNSADKSADIDLTQNNRRAGQSASTAYKAVRATQAIPPTAKVFLEFKADLVRNLAAATSRGFAVGLLCGSESLTSAGGLFTNNGVKHTGAGYEGSGIVAVGNGGTLATLAAGTGLTTIGLAISGPDKKIWPAINGVFSGDPDTNTGGFDITDLFDVGNVFPACSINADTGVDPSSVYIAINDGTDAFSYSKPSSFVAYKDMPLGAGARPRGLIIQ